MSLYIPNKPYHFIVDTASERNTGWHDGSLVYVKDANELYILDAGAWVQFATGLAGTDELVAVDVAATAGYLGVSNSDGVLRTDGTVDITDGGDYITLSLDSTLKTNYDAASAHVSADGSSHTFLDQDVTSASTPTFTATNITGVPAASVLAGTLGTGAYVFDNTVSGITTLTAADIVLSGASILANATASGVLTLGGTGGTYDENWLLDFESVENSILFSTSTGVTGTDWNADFIVGGRFGEGSRTLPAAGTDHAIYVYSDDTTVNTDYIKTSHNQANGIIQVGSGGLHLKSGNNQVKYFGSTTQLNFILADSTGVEHMNMLVDDNLVQTTFAPKDSVGNCLIITNGNNNTYINHDHGLQTNPTLFVHSDTNPNTANDEWISLTHDVANATINWGSGDLDLDGGDINITGGTVNASGGFEDNGTAGIDTTFLDNDGNTITVSGGIITAKTAP